MTMRYRVELAELEGFVEKLQAFERQAEAIAARIESKVEHLHSSWSGEAADAHRAHHDALMSAEAQMREALAGLREAAHNAHCNYTEAAALNVAMLT